MTCAGHLSRTVLMRGVPAQDKIKKARAVQRDATETLALLLQADDVNKVAAEIVDSLSEQFFVMANTYLEMAKQEGNAEVGVCRHCGKELAGFLKLMGRKFTTCAAAGCCREAENTAAGDPAVQQSARCQELSGAPAGVLPYC